MSRSSFRDASVTVGAAWYSRPCDGRLSPDSRQERAVPRSVEGGRRCARAPRGALARERRVDSHEVTVDDLARFAATFEDLADIDVMSRAWT
jgi:hypothetical protein